MDDRLRPPALRGIASSPFRPPRLGPAFWPPTDRHLLMGTWPLLALAVNLSLPATPPVL